MILNNTYIIKNCFDIFFKSKNKNLIEFSIGWLVKLYMNINESEENFILEIIFENVLTNYSLFSSTCDINRKKYNFEENYFFKFLKYNSTDMEKLYKIAFLYENFEKNFQKLFPKNNPSNTAQSINEITLNDNKLIYISKLEKFANCSLNNFQINFTDYLFIILGNKIKNPQQSTKDNQAHSNQLNIISSYTNQNSDLIHSQGLNKENIQDVNKIQDKKYNEYECEKKILKFINKKYDLVKYFYEICLIAVNFKKENIIENKLENIEDSKNSNKLFMKRKQLISVLLLFIKIIGFDFLENFVNHLRTIIKNRKDEFLKICEKSDFKILFESTFTTPNTIILDPKSSILKDLENIIIDRICKSNLKHSINQKEREFYEKNFSRNFNFLIKIIFLFEEILQIFPFEKNNFNPNYTLVNQDKYNISYFYEFYYMFQLRIMRNFVYNSPNPNLNKIHNYKNMIINNSFNIEDLLAKYDKDNPCKRIFETFLNLIENDKKENSLLFSNWIKMFFKNGNIFDCYKILRTILISRKKAPFSFMLYNINFEVQKYYPDLWK